MYLIVFILIQKLLFFALAAQSDNRKAEYKEDGVSVDIKLPVKHVLSRELQVLTMIMALWLLFVNWKIWLMQ